MIINMLIGCVLIILVIVILLGVELYRISNFNMWLNKYKMYNLIIKEKSKDCKFGCINSSYKEIKDLINKCKITRNPVYTYLYEITLDNITVGEKLDSLSYKEFVRQYCICNSLKLVINYKNNMNITLESEDDYVPTTLAYIILPLRDYYKLYNLLNSLYQKSETDKVLNNNIMLNELIKSYRSEQIQRSIKEFNDETGVNCIYRIDNNYNIFVDVDEEKESE